MVFGGGNCFDWTARTAWYWARAPFILTLFCLVVGVPTMTAQLAKDRRRRPGREKRIPAKALSVGFWFGIAFLVLFVLFGLVTLYVHVKYLHGVQFEEPAAPRGDAFGGGRPRGDGEGKDDDAAAPTPAPHKTTPKPTRRRRRRRASPTARRRCTSSAAP
jgi:hypothetical protein